MSETYILCEILKTLRQILAVEQSNNGYLAQIEKNTNPPSPQIASIGIDFSPPTPKE